MIVEFLLILILILLNGFFAAAEIAMVSARESRLLALSNDGNLRAAQALKLQRKPGEFLATVQVGITLVGTFASAVGGVEAASRLAPWLGQIPGLKQYSAQIALAIVVFTLSYASLLIGELVPKRLAIRQPERWAMAVAGIFAHLMRIAAWPTRVLLASADVLLRFFGDSGGENDDLSTEEVELLVRRGTSQGVFLPLQERLITRVFAYADRTTRDVMTPRTGIVALAGGKTPDQALRTAKEAGFSRFPVYRDDLDDLLGYVHIKDLIWAPPDMKLHQLARPVVYIPEGATLPNAFSRLTRAGRHMGIVFDEFGGTDGLITLEDLLEEIVGEIEDEHSPIAEVPQTRRPGEWRIAGATPIFEVGDLLELNFEIEGAYKTLAGFIMAELGRVPQEGDEVVRKGFRFCVETMDRFRIRSVLVKQMESDENSEQEAS
jgi:putative hemolysin